MAVLRLFGPARVSAGAGSVEEAEAVLKPRQVRLHPLPAPFRLVAGKQAAEEVDGIAGLLDLDAQAMKLGRVELVDSFAVPPNFLVQP